MARLRVHPERILRNVRKLSAFLSEHNVQWTLVAKVLSGDNDVLQHLLESDAFDNVHSIADARMSGLRRSKSSGAPITYFAAAIFMRQAPRAAASR